MDGDRAPLPAAGTVAVLDGRLVVADPAGAGRPARVRVGPGVRLVGVDVPDRGAVPVAAGGAVEVDVGSRPAVSALEVEVPPGGLEARLVVRVEDGVEYALEDQPAGAEVVLSRREVARIPAARPTEADARRALAERSVVRDIDDAALAGALARADGEPVVVARGRPAVPPQDARLEVPAALALARSPLATVPRGAVLAVRHPPVPGLDGYTVGGTPLLPARPRDAQVGAASGAVAEQAEDGTLTIRAAIDGRPVVRGAQIGVEPVVRVAAIDVGTGDVALRASLEVSGPVAEGRRVRVLGDLEVSGVVERAVLVAGGSITLTGACIHSRLHAGGPQAVYVRLLALIGDAGSELVALAAGAAELVAAAAARGRTVGEPEALGALLSSRFGTTRERLVAGARLVEAQPEGLLPDHLVRAMRAASVLVVAHEPPGSVATVDRAGHLIEDEVAVMRGAVAGPALVRAAYLQGCEVSAPGDLIITGRGCFNCEIAVGGGLECAAAGATLRGGAAHVGGRVRLAELGAPGMTPVTVVLEGVTESPDRLLAERAHEGAVVVCNGEALTMERDMGSVRIGVDADGHAALHGEPLLRGGRRAPGRASA